MKRATPEHDLQRHVAEYLTIVLPPTVLWSSIDHAGKDKVRQAMLKARGVKAGWPDIVIYWTGFCDESGQEHPNVGHIELKSHKGRMTPEQLIFAESCKALGHHHAIVKGIDDLRKVLREWEVPSRESNDNRAQSERVA